MESIATFSETGVATNIISGLPIGFESTLYLQ
jgi:Na+/H+-translocating membrane pyrophosphatase